MSGVPIVVAAKQPLLVLIPLAGAVLALGFTWFGDPQLAPSADGFEGAPTTVAGTMALGPGLAAGSVAATPRAAVGASVCGRTVRVGGEPVLGACVTAAGSAVITDAVGSFVLTGLPAGSVQLTASAPGLVALPIQPLWLAHDDALEDIEILLGEACFVAGRLVDPLGTALPGIEVQATLREVDAADGSPRAVGVKVVVA